jgi:hypothetical protein
MTSESDVARANASALSIAARTIRRRWKVEMTMEKFISGNV